MRAGAGAFMAGGSSERCAPALSFPKPDRRALLAGKLDQREARRVSPCAAHSSARRSRSDIARAKLRRPAPDQQLVAALERLPSCRPPRHSCRAARASPAPPASRICPARRDTSRALRPYPSLRCRAPPSRYAGLVAPEKPTLSAAFTASSITWKISAPFAASAGKRRSFRNASSAAAVFLPSSPSIGLAS